jgi:hypothetical protein
MRRSTPFDTPELDELRREQREFLLTVPTFLFRKLVPADKFVFPECAPEAAPFVEAGLRGLAADRLGGGEHADLVALLRKDADGQYLATHLGEVVGALRIDVPMQIQIMWDEAREGATERMSSISESAFGWLQSVVWVLVLADALASDGYRDPRAPVPADASS